MAKRKRNQQLQQFLQQQMQQKKSDNEFEYSLKAVDADFIQKKTQQMKQDDKRKRSLRKDLVINTQGYNQKQYLDKLEEMRAQALVDRSNYHVMAKEDAIKEDMRIKAERQKEIEKKLRFKGELDNLNREKSLEKSFNEHRTMITDEVSKAINMSPEAATKFKMTSPKQSNYANPDTGILGAFLSNSNTKNHHNLMNSLSNTIDAKAKALEDRLPKMIS